MRVAGFQLENLDLELIVCREMRLTLKSGIKSVLVGSGSVFLGRAIYVALIVMLFWCAGCETQPPANGAGIITKERAIAIAVDANKDPEFDKVTRATWRTDPTATGGGYWAIDLRDEDEELGRFFLVDGHGKIVGQGRIDGDRYF